MDYNIWEGHWVMPKTEVCPGGWMGRILSLVGLCRGQAIIMRMGLVRVAWVGRGS